MQKLERRARSDPLVFGFLGLFARGSSLLTQSLSLSLGFAFFLFVVATFATNCAIEFLFDFGQFLDSVLQLIFGCNSPEAIQEILTAFCEF